MRASSGADETRASRRLKTLLVTTLVIGVAIFIAGMVFTLQKQLGTPTDLRTDPEREVTSKNTSGTAVSSSIKRPIRVGFTKNGFWCRDLENNAVDSYGPHYLETLSRYTGWTYEFKEYPHGKLKEALASGEIDLMGPVSFESATSQDTFLPIRINGESKVTYYVLSNSTIGYRDYKSFNNKRIGVLKNSSCQRRLDEDARLHDFSYKPVYFNSVNDLIRAAYAGKYDIMVVQSMFVSKNEHFKVVSELSAGNFYFLASNKSVEIARELTQAIESAQLADPTLDESLAKEYLETPVYTTPRFTQEEVTYLKKAPVLRVAFVDGRAPIETKAAANSYSRSGIDGIVGKILDLLSERTGLKFRGVVYPTAKAAEEGVKRGEADLLGNTSAEQNNAGGDQLITTVPYLSFPVVAVSKNGAVKRDKPIVAVPYHLRWIITEAKRRNADATFKEFESRNDTFEALHKGKVDYVLCGTPVANEILRNSRFSNLKTTYYTDAADNLMLGLSGSSDKRLLGILNKGILSLGTNDTNDLISQASAEDTGISPLKIIKLYWTWILLVLAIFCVVLLSVLYTIRKKNLEEVENIAYVDPVTGLPNRTKFINDVEQVMDSERSGLTAIAVLDIDGFKSINDMYGVTFGDELLHYLGERIVGSAPANSLVASGAGDLFFLCFTYQEPEELINDITTIIGALNRISFKHAGMLDLSVSAGIYELSPSDNNPNTAINCADIARMDIKGSHSTHYSFFTEEMRIQLANETILENDLKLALERNEFELYYQPQVDITCGRVTGFEALIRWNHPLAGILGPAAFIPLAERVGLITQITEWVINRSCTDIAGIRKRWAADLPGVSALLNRQDLCEQSLPTISINLSALDLANPHLVGLLRKGLEDNLLSPQVMEIEITESALLNDTQTYLKTINRIRNRGLKIALDDFGTGYSSLSWLKDLPLSTVKLDRVFIRDIEVDQRSQKVLRSIVSLVRTLDYSIIAEGVENTFQVEFLSEIGCNLVQGFYFAPGMPLDEAYQYFIDTLSGGARGIDTDE